MAMTFVATVGGDTLNLNDGNPFWLDGLSGLAGTDIARYEQRGPLQDGATDLGVRLGARDLTLSLLFYATTDALLDSYRDTLTTRFAPRDDLAIVLSVTRDDAETRYLTVYATDDIAINLVPGDRPGHLHRALVRLRADYPLWQSAEQSAGTPTVGGNFAVYPDITVVGPVTNPVLTNSENSGSINLSGLTLGAGESVRILMSDGNKRVVNAAGSNILGSVTNFPVGILDFTLAYDGQNGSDGVNTITLTGSGTTAATDVVVTWTDKFLSF